MSKRPWNPKKAVSLLPQWARDRIRELEEEVVMLKTDLVRVTGALPTNIFVEPPAPHPMFGVPARSAVHFHLSPDGVQDPFNRDRVKVYVQSVRLRDELHHSLSISSVRPMFLAPQAPTTLIIDLGGSDL